MRSLIFEGPRQLAWHDVPEPTLASDQEALAAPIAIAACDLDHFIAAGATRFPAGIALGHECVARVTAVGPAVTSVRPGDLVTIPFQISCGACPACRAGHTGNCETVGPFTTYGFGVRGTKFGGMYADTVRVPFADAMLVKLPDGVDPVAAASVSDNVADGFRAVAPFVSAGDRVLVLGGLAASVGLYAAGCAVALGAAVDYVDDAPDRLDRARQLGANAIEGRPEKPPGRYPLVVDASGTPLGLKVALQSVAFEGVCYAVAMDFGNASVVPLLDMYLAGVTFKTGRAHARPVIPRILELMAAGELRPELVTSAVVEPGEVPERLIAGDYAKLVCRWA